MARSTVATRPGSELPQVSPVQGIQLIEALIERADQLLKSRPLGKDDHSTWEMIARNHLEKAFGKDSPNVHSVTSVGKYVVYRSAIDRDQRRYESLQTQRHRLVGLRDLLKTELQLNEGAAVEASPKPHGHKIFLVHGHDDGVLHETARFLELLRQEVIVLREQPNKGRTIIEKFEDYADVGFAVILSSWCFM